MLSCEVPVSFKSEVGNLFRRKGRQLSLKDIDLNPLEKEKIFVEKCIEKIVNENPRSKISEVILSNLINYEEPGSVNLKELIDSL